MKEIPQDVTESVKRRNPHLYGPGKPNPSVAELKSNVVETHRAARASKSVEERLNKTERRFLVILRTRKYKRLGIQDFTLRLANSLRYTPDFSSCDVFGHLTFWEVKGPYIREDAAIKLKMAASLLPEFTFVRAQWKDGKWTETEIKP